MAYYYKEVKKDKSVAGEYITTSKVTPWSEPCNHGTSKQKKEWKSGKKYKVAYMVTVTYKIVHAYKKTTKRKWLYCPDSNVYIPYNSIALARDAEGSSGSNTPFSKLLKKD